MATQSSGSTDKLKEGEGNGEANCKYAFSIHCDNITDEGKLIVGNHTKVNNIQHTYLSHSQQRYHNYYSYNKFVVLNILPTETSSDSERETFNKRHKRSRRKSKAKNGFNSNKKIELNDNDSWKKNGRQDRQLGSVFKSNQSSVASKGRGKDVSVNVSTDQASSPQQFSNCTVRERKSKTKSIELIRNNRNSRKSHRGKACEATFSPLSIAIMQTLCYVSSFAMGCYMELSLWPLPYVCYCIFACFNVAYCLGCLRFHPINDISAGVRITDKMLLFKLIGLFIAVSLAFLSSLMFGCTSCSWIQTMVIFIASTWPYLTFDKGMIMPRGFQDHCRVFSLN